MTNRQKYAEQILDIACSGSRIAINKDNMKLRQCKDADCDERYFATLEDCSIACQNWCNAEYIEPPVDWSKVPVDTPILVSEYDDGFGWERRHFAKFQNGQVYAWAEGRTSWSARGKCMSWEHAKLAESED